MVALLTLLVLLELTKCHCTDYYDNELWIDEDYNSDKKALIDESDYRMLISGGYRPINALYTKYLASIRTSKPMQFFGDNHYCSGTIVAFRLIITAAHCFVNFRKIVTRARRVQVILGTPNRLQRNIYTVYMSVSDIWIHPEFNRDSRHDLAILQLESDIPFENPNIEITRLTTKRPPPMTKCTTVGWGQLLYMGPFAAEAVYVDLEILDPVQCTKYYGRKFDERYSLCVGDWNGENDTEKSVCHGDSGGPLICDGYLSGIVSSGIYCGRSEIPNIFTDIYGHRDWIIAIKNSKAPFISSALLSYINVLFVNLL